jgi:ribose 5-phosphate isomerase B
MASDHGGHDLKGFLAHKLQDAGFEVIDYGDSRMDPEDDYPDFVVPMARAVARGDADRGVAICASGVGACVVANKVPGVRACLIQDSFPARQGVEDDNLNVICLGGRLTTHEFAWELVKTFLDARFSGAERHRRRLAKMSALETPETSP